MKKNSPIRSDSELTYGLALATQDPDALLGRLGEHVAQRLGEICGEYGWSLITAEVQPDHVRLSVSAPPDMAPMTISDTLKSRITRDVLLHFGDAFPLRLGGKSLFTPGCFFRSIGVVSDDALHHYLEAQRSPPTRADH